MFTSRRSTAAAADRLHINVSFSFHWKRVRSSVYALLIGRGIPPRCVKESARALQL